MLAIEQQLFDYDRPNSESRVPIASLMILID